MTLRDRWTLIIAGHAAFYRLHIGRPRRSLSAVPQQPIGTQTTRQPGSAFGILVSPPGRSR